MTVSPTARFHRHEESWLGLVLGQKLWCLHSPTAAGQPPPATAFARATLAELRSAAANAAADGGPGRRPVQPMLQVHQMPGEVVYLPSGWWHATYNCSAAAGLSDLTGASGDGDDGGPAGSAVAVAVGGLGAAESLLERLACVGDVAGLVELSRSEDYKAGLASGLRARALELAAEQGQLAAVEWLLESRSACQADAGGADGDAGGASSHALHWACGGGAVEVVRALLLQVSQSQGLCIMTKDRCITATANSSAANSSAVPQRGVSAAAVGPAGTRPLHWAARSGDPAVVELLLAVPPPKCPLLAVPLKCPTSRHPPERNLNRPRLIVSASSMCPLI